MGALKARQRSIRPSPARPLPEERQGSPDAWTAALRHEMARVAFRYITHIEQDQKIDRSELPVISRRAADLRSELDVPLEKRRLPGC